MSEELRKALDDYTIAEARVRALDMFDKCRAPAARSLLAALDREKDAKPNGPSREWLKKAGDAESECPSVTAGVPPKAEERTAENADDVLREARARFLLARQYARSYAEGVMERIETALQREREAIRRVAEEIVHDGHSVGRGCDDYIPRSLRRAWVAALREAIGE